MVISLLKIKKRNLEEIDKSIFKLIKAKEDIKKDVFKDTFLNLAETLNYWADYCHTQSRKRKYKKIKVKNNNE